MVVASCSDVANALRTIFTSTADNAARETKFVQRRGKWTGPLFAQTLTFGWLANPKATLEDLAQTANSLGLAVSPQGLDQRFTPQAAEFLHDVLQAAVERVVTADPVAVPLLQRFAKGVHVLDSTTITLPEALAPLWAGCGNATADGLAGVKLQVRLDLLHGTLRGPVLYPGRAADYHDAIPEAARPGALLLADLGYFRLDTFQQYTQQGVYWLSRLKAGTKIITAAGQQRTLAALLDPSLPASVDMPISLGMEHRLPCRLLAVRVPAAVAEQRRRRLRQKAGRQGKKIHPDCLRLAEWTVYVTNMPETLLTVREALVLARCRWQIELLFKLWKSEGHIDKSRSEKPWRILCEVYAKLLGMVVQHWTLLVSCWSHADRSLRKASHTVRAHITSLAVALAHGQMVCGILSHIQNCLAHGCRLNKRRKEPSTYQMLFALTESGETG